MSEKEVDTQLTMALKSPFKRRSYRLIKRLFDILWSLTGIIVSAPLLLGIAILVKLDSPGPILFRQTRIGQGGRPFELLRFRSMTVDLDPGVRKELETSLYNMRYDPRVTRVGRMLRLLSLDELPQLLNVLRGEMSVVGPRPALPYELGLHDERDRVRVQMPPGMTGLWQASKAKRDPYEADLEYFTHASLWMDLKILCRTVVATLQGKGAY